jgi:hypothetical protein
MVDRIDEKPYVNQNGTVTQWSIALLIVDNTTVEWDVAMELARTIIVLATEHTVFPVISGKDEE